MAGHSGRRSSAQKAESRNPAKAERKVSTRSRRRKRPSAGDPEAQLKHRIDELALENSRLLAELRQRSDDLSESLLQQAATSEVLQVISSSISDVEPVFEKLLENVTGLFDGEAYRRVALYNVPPSFTAIAPKEIRLDDKSNGPLHPRSHM